MFRKLWFLANRRQMQRELDEEMRFHAEQSGSRFGDVTRWRESSRDEWSWMALDDFVRDVRQTMRGMRRTPAFTAAAVALLALAIGATTTVHTVSRALLSELPVTDPGTLVQLVHNDPGQSKLVAEHSYPAWQMLAEPKQTVRDVFGFTDFLMQVLVVDRGTGELARAQGVTANYFSALRLQPAMGRLLDRPAEPFVVLGHAYWQRRFGSDPRVLDHRSLVIDGKSFGVAGVAPPAFHGIERGKAPDLYFPVEYTMELRGGGKLQFAGSWWMSVMARLQPGVAVEAARVELEPYSRTARDMAVTSLPPQFAGSVRRHFDQLQFRVVPAATGSLSGLQQKSEQPIRVLTAAVLILLLIGCANLAGLLVSRGAAREKELGLRIALGCGRARLVRQMLTETLVLAVLGGTVGLGLAVWWGPHLLALLAGEELLSAVEVGPDARVLALLVLSVLITAVLTGIVPAIRAAAWHSRSGSTRPAQALVALQIALSVVLLTCAGLFARTIANFRSIDSGFRHERLISAQANPTVVKYKSERLTAYGRAALERLRALPGVESATVTESPLGSLSWTTMVEAAGHRAPVGRNPAGPRFAATLGLRLLSGRDLSESDYGRLVAVVNGSFVREFLQGADALGRQVRMLDGSKVFEIVGVVADARDRGIKRAPEPVIYTWWEHDLIGWMTFSVRGRATGNEIRAALRATDPAVPVNAVQTADELLNRELVRERMMATVGGAFGGAAALASAVGLYAALAFSVAKRMREFGIRKALGAGNSRVVASATRQSVAALLCGLGAGVPAAVVAGHALRSQLFGVGSLDPWLLFAVAMLMTFAAAAASALPVFRAVRVSPAEALRNDG